MNAPLITTTNGWEVRAMPDRSRPNTWKVTAISADRKRVINRDRLTEAEALAFDPDADWYAGLVTSGRAPRRS